MYNLLLQQVEENKFPFHPTWLMIVIILCIMILGYLFSAFNSRFVLVLKSLVQNRAVEQFSREEYSLSHPASIFLSINFLLAVSLFLLLVLTPMDGILRIDLTLFSFIKIVLLVFAIYAAKIFVIRLVGFIFDREAVAREYIFLVYLVSQAAGVAMIPVIVFVAYAPEWLSEISFYLGIAILAASYILRIAKGILANLSGGHMSAIYLLLYLCTLEILPVLFAYKLFIEAGF